MREYKVIPYRNSDGEPLSLNYIQADCLEEAIANAKERLPLQEIEGCTMDTFPRKYKNNGNI